MNVLAHGNEARRVTVMDVGDALPEEPLEVLPEPIALLKLPLDCPDYPPHRLSGIGNYFWIP